MDTTVAMQVSQGDALRALSVALDLTMCRRWGHCRSTATLCTAVGRRMGLPESELEEMMLAALLKDSG